MRTPAARRVRGDLAPLWHTAALVGSMVAVAMAGAWTRLGAVGQADPSSAEPGSRILWVYLPALVVEWGLTLVVCRVGRPRNVLGDLLGKRWRDARRAAGDVLLALAGFVLIEALETGYAGLAGARPDSAASAWLPQGPAERLIWVLVAGSAGFCEEVVYRGYLQTQVSALTRSASVGIAFQAALFGIAHGEHGLAAAARFALYGALFGVLARWRGSLVPGILCHVAIDLTSGLLR